MAPDFHPTLGIFASDRGPGDAERAAIMSEAGSFLARKGARIVCLAENGIVPVPLITSARSAGGAVTLLADEATQEPTALAEIAIEHHASADDRLRRLAALSTLYVALPGSLASATSLYLTWVRGGGGPGRKPVVFYDRNGAFKVVRGYASDVISSSIRHHDHYVQFADSMDDLWGKIVWLIEQKAAG